jgi:hypothetical protein
MDMLDSLQPLMSDTLVALVKLSPLQMLCGVGVVGILAAWASRSRDTLLITLTALLYAVPFLITLWGHGA